MEELEGMYLSKEIIFLSTLSYARSKSGYLYKLNMLLRSTGFYVLSLPHYCHEKQ